MDFHFLKLKSQAVDVSISQIKREASRKVNGLPEVVKPGSGVHLPVYLSRTPQCPLYRNTGVQLVLTIPQPLEWLMDLHVPAPDVPWQELHSQTMVPGGHVL